MGLFRLFIRGFDRQTLREVDGSVGGLLSSPNRPFDFVENGRHSEVAATKPALPYNNMSVQSMKPQANHVYARQEPWKSTICCQ
jgi:hypothetical protein